MSTILATATTPADHACTQSEAKELVRAWLGESHGRLRGALDAFDHAQVERRSAAIPAADVFTRRGFGASNDLYLEHAVELATRVTRQVLQAASLAPSDVDFFVSTSCTGFAIPSIDAHVAERLGMKSTLRRLPITEHGCAGGAVALGCAHEHLVANDDRERERFALVVAVELPSLTFQVDDRSPANLVSAALFGDGAAAVVLSSRARAGAPRVVRVGSRRFAQSLDWMGYRLRDSGLHVVLSREIPRQVRAHAREIVTSFLDECGLELADVQHLLFHPGGRRILEAFTEALELPHDALASSRAVLRDHGNLSSATVLFVLDHELRHVPAQRGDRGLLLAFGPGFGAELVLLEWT